MAAPRKEGRRFRLPLGPLLAGLLGAGVFLLRIGPRILPTGSVTWLHANSDSAMCQLGWEFLRREPWRLPLGAITGYMAPQGTTVAMTDSLPLAAVLLKLFAPLLPADFQFFGLWLLLCYALQGAFAWLLAARLLPGRALRAAAAALIFLAPAFLNRDAHFTLTAHWQLLAALWLYLRAGDGAQGWRRRLGPWLVLLPVACGTHFYLGVMVLGFAAAALARGRLTAPRRRPWLWPVETAAALGLAVGGWALLGFLKFGDITRDTGSSFAVSSLNLNGFWNSQGLARLPGLPIAVVNDYEAFNYLGLGALLAIALAIGMLAARRAGLGPGTLRRHWPLAVVTLVFWLMAVGDRIAWNGAVLLSYTAPGPLATLLDPFRASARFAWPVAYLLLAAALTATGRRFRPRTALAVVAGCLALQLWDLGPLLDRRDHYRDMTFTTRLQDPQWDEAMRRADKILTYPPRMKHTVFEDDFLDLSLLALRHGATTSAGYAARDFRSSVVAGVEGMKEELFGGEPDPRALYVLRYAYFAENYPALMQDFTATDLDGFAVLFARDGGFRPRRVYRVETVGLGDYLERHAGRTVVMVAKDEAAQRLDPAFKERMRGLGSRIDQLPYGGAYVGIVVHGDLVFEQFDEDQEVVLGGSAGARMGEVMVRRPFTVASGGRTGTNRASLDLDGVEALFNCRGLNVAVLDDVQRLMEVAVFDTHAGTAGHAYRLRSNPDR